jgi:hypothetical protein
MAELLKVSEERPENSDNVSTTEQIKQPMFFTFGDTQEAFQPRRKQSSRKSVAGQMAFDFFAITSDEDPAAA